MNLVAAAVSLFAVHLPAPVAKPPVDMVRMAGAIEAVENTPNEKVGLYGERSRFQITREVWQRHSAMPFEYASSNRLVCRAEVTRVAMEHLHWLRIRLAIHNIPETPYYIALAWGAGVAKTVSGTASANKRDYAQRAENLYVAGKY
jgi:hypothetical protein